MAQTVMSVDFADNSLGTLILGVSIAGGVMYGVTKHKSVGSTIMYATLFGLSGAILSVIISNVSTTTKSV